MSESFQVQAASTTRGVPPWLRDYQAKLTSAEQAVRSVPSGERVYIHPGAAEPEVLVLALIGRAAELRDVEIVHLMTLGNADYVKPEMAGHFRHIAFFVGSNVLEAINAGRAEYLPVLLYSLSPWSVTAERCSRGRSRRTSMWRLHGPGRRWTSSGCALPGFVSVHQARLRL